MGKSLNQPELVICCQLHGDTQSVARVCSQKLILACKYKGVEIVLLGDYNWNVIASLLI